MMSGPVLDHCLVALLAHLNLAHRPSDRLSPASRQHASCDLRLQALYGEASLGLGAFPSDPLPHSEPLHPIQPHLSMFIPSQV